MCPLASVCSECLFEVVFPHQILQTDQHLLESLCWSLLYVLCKKQNGYLKILSALSLIYVSLLIC